MVETLCIFPYYYPYLSPMFYSLIRSYMLYTEI